MGFILISGFISLGSFGVIGGFFFLSSVSHSNVKKGFIKTIVKKETQAFYLFAHKTTPF